jgi:hypothetical protein
MSEELWKYLPHVPNVKKSAVIKRKSEVTDKEVLNLTGGLFPIKLVDTSKNVSSTLSRMDRIFNLLTTGFAYPLSSATKK